jgi:hypothetical protein
MSLTINRFLTRCEIPRRMSERAHLADRVARERFAAQCGRFLDAWPAQLGIIRIRRLAVKLRVDPSRFDESSLSQAWAEAFLQELKIVLAYPTGAGKIEVVRAESRAAWLATFIVDLLAGIAPQCWQYAEFQQFFGLAKAEAVLTLLAQEPAEAVPTLLALDRSGTLQRMLDLFDEYDLERLFRIISDGLGESTETRISIGDLLMVGRLVLARHPPTETKLDGRRYALGLFLRLNESQIGEWTPRRILYTLIALVALGDRLRIDESRPWRSELTGEPTKDERGHLLLPDAVIRVLEEVRAITSAADDSPSSNDIAALAMLVENLRSALSPSHIATKQKEEAWVNSECAGLFLLVGTLKQLDWYTKMLASPFAAAHGSGSVTYLMAGLGLAVLDRFTEIPEKLDCGVALFAGWEGDPNLAGMRRFFESTSADDRRQLLAKLLGDEEDIERSALTWRQSFNVMAERVIRKFADKVRGFRGAHRSFVTRQLLSVPGRVRIGNEHILVVLSPRPFNVALHVSAMDEPVDYVSWLGNRRVEFYLEGL